MGKRHVMGVLTPQNRLSKQPFIIPCLLKAMV